MAFVSRAPHPVAALVALMCAMPAQASPSPQSAKSEDAGSFAKVIDSVLHDKGQDHTLVPNFCRLMRLATNSEQRCPTKQVGVATGTDQYPANFIDVGTDAVSGQVRVVIWNEFKTDAGVLQGLFYVTSASGVLEQALDMGGGQTNELSLDSATNLDFEKEKAFWVQRLGRP
jgi:hypothetical protein